MGCSSKQEAQKTNVSNIKKKRLMEWIIIIRGPLLLLARDFKILRDGSVDVILKT
jgi:hypothetical protein